MQKHKNQEKCGSKKINHKIQNIKKGITYVNALYEKMNLINFIRKYLDVAPAAKFNDIMKIKVQNHIDLFGEEVDSIFTTEHIFIEYSVTVANSFSDLMLQLINAEVLRMKHKEKDITLAKVKNDLKTSLKYANLKSLLDDLTNSDERKYINSFTNKVKHENIIRKRSRISSGNDNGPVICAFEKDEIMYPECSWKIVYEKIDLVFKKAVAIGIEVDKLL